METLLMCFRAGGDELEAEPAVVTHDDVDAHLVLDDGERITFDRGELASALQGGRDSRTTR